MRNELESWDENCQRGFCPCGVCKSDSGGKPRRPRASRGGRPPPPGHPQLAVQLIARCCCHTSLALGAATHRGGGQCSGPQVVVILLPAQRKLVHTPASTPSPTLGQPHMHNTHSLFFCLVRRVPSFHSIKQLSNSVTK
ncbi:hypothetical protein Pcinc_021878 [Petrolisthes cinctipes]|uniref:Uncharacterized protein n=1 Tax=Petrolisthes cinctipes TaxID=88211 RepID=A0AAE1FER3_PETCI|nr:hypothetical protein Pcinc_021878 [Petrolisthes cinctipes]